MNRRDLLFAAAALGACAPAESRRSAHAPAPFPMRRGVNLGNALEAPNEGEWGYRIEADHLAAIAAAGFDGVRLPVRWDAHADARGRIAPALLARVGEVVDWALARGLKVQLDCHHYDALIAAGPRSREAGRFLSIWRALALHYSDRPPALSFEPLNEPHGAAWAGEALAELQAEAVAAIRETNPDRTVVLGPPNWQNIDALARWRPPPGENVAVSVHYYEPHAFTHQGAEWLGADAPRFGREWGAPQDRRDVAVHIARAAAWGEANGYAVQLGEFGVYRTVSAPQRAAWTRTVREACEANGLAWCVWDFAGAFPIFDRARGALIPELRAALFD